MHIDDIIISSPFISLSMLFTVPKEELVGLQGGMTMYPQLN